MLLYLLRKLTVFLDIGILLAFNIFVTRNILVSSFFSVMIVLGLYAFRTYDAEYLPSFNEQIIRVTSGTIFGFVGVLFFFYLYADQINRYNFIYNFLFSLAVFPAIHMATFYITKNNIKPTRYLVIGKKDKIYPILKEVEEKTYGKLIFSDFVNPTSIALEAGMEMNDAILIADPKLAKEVKATIEKFKERGVQVIHLPTLIEKHLKRIPLEVAERFKEYYELAFENVNGSPAKRILDILVSSILLIIFSPIMLLIAIAILIEDGPPIVFKQERLGKDGKVFIMHKFRSMKNGKNDAPKFADDEQHRVLKIGRLIRPFRLDETLQFWDILKGEMSIVGPRPEQLEFAKKFMKTIPFYWARHRIKPGLTGWAQIMYKYASSAEETQEKLSYDLYYVKNRNILLDLDILLRTVEAMLWKRGAK